MKILRYIIDVDFDENLTFLTVIVKRLYILFKLYNIRDVHII